MIWFIAEMKKGGTKSYLNIQEKAGEKAKQFWIPETKTTHSKKQALYPKYIFVDFDTVDEAMSTNITWLKSPGTDCPYGLLLEEEATIMDVEYSKPDIKEQKEYLPGDLVEVVKGPFKGKKGFVSAITKDNIQLEGRYRLWVSKGDL